MDCKNSQTLLIRSCVYQGAAAVRWGADLLPAGSEIDDEIKRDVLGSRKKILFVEGTEKSLDQPLYSLIFPGVSVIAKRSCRDVEHFVSSIRDAAPLHWLSAWEIVDNDRRSLASIAKLKEKGVYALEHHSIESIYYHPGTLHRMAVRHSEIIGGDPEQMTREATTAVVTAVAPHKERLSARVSENKVREAVFRNLPTRKSMQARAPIKLEIDVNAIVAEEAAALDEALSTSDIKVLIGRYPVRETPALGAIVGKLGFQSEEQYESAVRKLLSDDEEALRFAKSLFGDLPSDIEGKSEFASRSASAQQNESL